MWWPRRKIDLKVRVRLKRVVYQFHKRVFRNLRPGGETKPAARLENTGRFGASALRISEIKKRKVRDDAIKAGIRKRKILRVALTKFDLGKHFLRNRDHFGGKIETDRICAVFGGSGRDVTGSAADVQDRHLLGNIRGIEQRRNELAGRDLPNPKAILCGRRPALLVEIL